jgi:tRNA (guanine-N7-)-methyltransferase
MSDTPITERRNFYGRIHGKTLRASQKTYLAEGLEALSVPLVHRDANPARVPLDVAGSRGGGPCGLRWALAEVSIWCIWRRAIRMCS